MDRLRDPGGCPWDREQQLEDLRSYVLEEAYEVVEAIDRRDHAGLRDELGDLLLQVMFLSRIESEAGHFDVGDVVQGLRDKLVRRHPHVFGDATADTPRQVQEQWERLKRRERSDRGVLDGVPRALPALLRASRLSSKAAAVGFDWQRDEDVDAKLREEIEEFLTEERGGDAAAMEREFGDILFVLVNIARRAGVDPEAALQGSNDRFRSRFQHIESALEARGKSLEQADLEEMEELWEEAKGREP